MLDIRDFGAKPDGKTDTTPALNKAVKETLLNSSSIRFPVGKFVFSSPPEVIPVGTVIMGDGNASPSRDGYGTQLFVDYPVDQPEQPFLCWNGSFTQTATGAGGGVRDLVIMRSAAHKGGTALLMAGVNDNHRAGWMYFSNVLVTGEQHGTGGTWDYGLLYEGKGLTTGVRDNAAYNLSLYRCTTSAAEFRTITHLYWVGGSVGNAGLTKDPKVVFTGGPDKGRQTSNVHIQSVGIFGDLFYDHTLEFIFTGKIGGSLNISRNCWYGIVTAIVGREVKNQGNKVRVMTQN